MILNARSLANLDGVHPDLVKVIVHAAQKAGESLGFVVTEGARPIEKQKLLVDTGASKTMRSRHVAEMNECAKPCAVDLAAWIDSDGDGNTDNGEIRWDWPLYAKLAGIVKEAAHIEGVPIEWGGDWTSFKDGPHFQLPWSKYP